MTSSRDIQGSVVVCCGHFHPHMGGVERFTQCLWSRLAARGWNVTVVTTNTDRAAPEEMVDGLRVLRLPVWNLLNARVPWFKPSRMLWRVRRQILSSPPDVFVMNTRFFCTSILASRLAKATGRPLIHIEHGSAHITVGRPMIDWATRAFDRCVGRWVLKHATRRLGVSRSVCDFVETFGFDDADVLYNAVDTGAFVDPAGGPVRKAAPRIDYRRQLGVAPGEVLIVYAGRLVAEKGAADALAAYQRMTHRVRVHLAYAGDGPLHEMLRKAAENDPRLHVLGRLQADAMRDLLLSGDVFAYPSAYPEGLPTVVLEAGAAGMAIVATPMGGTEEVIPSETHGIIVPPNDPGRLADALDRFVADPAYRESCGRTVRRHVQDRFDWAAVATQMEQEMLALLGRTDSSTALARAS